jgi:hypothetical protein
MSEPESKPDHHILVLRGHGGEVFSILADVITDRATALSMAWFALAHYRATSAELYAGEYV